MSKYLNDFKLEVVKYYNEQHCGYQCTANKFNIPSITTVKKWVKKYNEHGEKGLLKNLFLIIQNKIIYLIESAS